LAQTLLDMKMITCRCPKCQAVFDAPSGQFGETVRCRSCSHSWTLDVEEIARYRLPSVVHVHVRDEAGIGLPGREVEVEYNYPVLKVQTGSDGTAMITEDMIRKGLAEYISIDGIMDHKGEHHACERHLHFHVGPVTETVDLSLGRREVEVDIRV